MLAKKNRFHGHRSVSRVRGGRVQLSDFKVFYSKTKRTDYRMAVVVSKKVAKSAVTRNRIRRRLYESVRKQGTLTGKPVDAVFVVQKDTLATVEASKLDSQVQKACEKILSN